MKGSSQQRSAGLEEAGLPYTRPVQRVAKGAALSVFGLLGPKKPTGVRSGQCVDAGAGAGGAESARQLRRRAPSSGGGLSREGCELAHG